MEELKSHLLLEMEELLGRQVSYGSAAPSILRDLEIRDLRVYGGDGSALVEIPLLKIRYRLLRILRGDPMGAVREIILENALINLDLDREQDLLQRLQAPAGGGAENGKTWEAGAGTTAGQFRLTGRNISVNYRSGDRDFTARRLFFHLNPQTEGYDLRLRSLLVYSSRDSREKLRRARTLVELQGLLAPDLSQGEASIGFSRLETNLFDLEKQTFQVSLDESGLWVRKIQDRAPLDFAVFYDFNQASLRGEVLSEKFRPAGLLTMKEDLSGLNQWLGTLVSLRGQGSYSLETGTLDYQADFDLYYPGPGPVRQTRLAGISRGDESRLVFSPLRITRPQGQAVFTGDLLLADFLPQGSLLLRDISLGGPNRLQGRFDVERIADGLVLRSRELSLGEVFLDDLYGSFRIRPDGWEAAAGLALDPQGFSGVRAFLFWPAGQEEGARFSLGMQALPANHLQSLLRFLDPRVPEFYTPFVVDLQFSGELGPQGPSLDLPYFALRDPAAEETVLGLQGSYDRGRIDLDHWQVAWKAYRGGGSIFGEIAGDGLFHFTARSRVQTVSYQVDGVYDPRGVLSLEEAQGLSARIRRRPWGALEASLQLKSFPVPLRRQIMELSGGIETQYQGTDSWQLEIRDFLAQNISPRPHLTGELGLSASLGPRGGRLRELLYADQFSRLQGEGNIRYSRNPLKVEAGVALAQTDGREGGDLLIRWGEEGLSGILSLRAFPLERLAGEAASGELQGSLSFAGLPADPRASLTVRLSQGRVGGELTGFQLSAGLGDRGAELFELEGFYGDLHLREGQARYDRETGALHFSGAGGPGRTEWRLTGDFTTQPGEGEDLRRQLAGSRLAGDLIVATDSSAVPAPYRYWGFNIRKEKKRLRLAGGPGNSLEGEMSEDGSFRLRVRDPLPVSFEAEGRYRDGELEANLNRIVFAAENFGDALDLGIIRFTRGQATGNLRIVGPLRDPEFYGTMRVRQGYAHLELIPEVLGPYEGNVIFREKEFSVLPMTVPVGRGSAEFSGVFQFHRWIPEIFTLTVDTKLSPGVHIAQDFGGVIVDGMGQGRVQIQGDGQRVTVSGAVNASNAIITLGDLEAAEARAQEEDQGSIQVDLSFQTGKSVEFYWPSPDFPILQAYANRGESLHLFFDSDSDDFRLVGDIGVRGGEIFYFERRFFIREGSIRFNERTDSFDPILNARAEIRESTNEGLVRIYLIADNTKLSQFSPRFESDSALAANEIMALLGRNVFGTGDGGPIDLSTALLFTSDILTQIGVVKTFEKEMRNRFKLDLFSVRTHLVQNLLENVVSRESETPRDLDTPSFGRYLDKTSVFLGKYIGSDLFLELLLQLRAADPLSQEIRDFGGLDIDAELILEWNTPLFLLEWSLFPKNPEELFIRDNKITFRWKFSY